MFLWNSPSSVNDAIRAHCSCNVHARISSFDFDFGLGRFRGTSDLSSEVLEDEIGEKNENQGDAVREDDNSRGQIPGDR